VASAPAVVEAAGWERREVMALRDSRELTPSRRNGRLVALQLDDLGSALSNGLLVKVDRMTMAASLEARCPFLDYRVVNFGLGLPDAWKIRRRTSKVLLRRAVRELLPRDIHDRAKHTFRVPLAQWLRGPLRDLVREAASSPLLAQLGIVRGEAIRDLAEDHVVGRADFSRALWAVVTLHLWLAEASRHVALVPTE
jgi:asparagine synthase (glutamine-hydrolysing)